MTTEIRDELMKRLEKAQNNKANRSQDIMTFSGFMDNEELLAHVLRYEACCK